MIPKSFTVLSVDFDYWYPGWDNEEGDPHCGRCSGCIKEVRGSPLRPEEADCPSTDVTVKEVLGLVKENTPVYVAECHGDIVGVLHRYLANNRAVTVYDIDHHNDCGVYDPHREKTYSSEWDRLLTCANWITVAEEEGLIERRVYLAYEGIPVPPNVVFTCKSSPYMMPEGDDHWHEWLRALESKGCPMTFWGFMRRGVKKDYESYLLGRKER